jgi:formylglycine-generating enzyme required for sulfatase activity
MDLSTLTQPDTLKALGLTLAAAAKFLGTATAEKVVQDAYDAVKNRLLTAFGQKDDIENALGQIERKPDSPHPPAMLADDLTPTAAAQDPELLRLVRTLADFLKQKGQLPPTFQFVTQTGDGGVAVGQGNTVAGTGGTAVGGDVHGDVLVGSTKIVQTPPAPDSDDALLAAYLAYLTTDCAQLKLKAIDLGAARLNRKPLGLDQVYVDLNLDLPIPTGQSFKAYLAAQEEKSDPTRLERHDAAGEMAEEARKTRQVPVLEALACQPRLVLLGAPGSGKSTLTAHVALSLAQARQGDSTALPRLGQWWGSGALLPVRVVLRKFAASLPAGLEQGRAGHLWKFLADELEGCGLPRKTAEAIQRAAHDSGALFLLDGLDEARDPATRARVLEAVAEFPQSAGSHCRFLLTTRPYAWEEPRHGAPVSDPVSSTLAEFPLAHKLADFDTDQIKTFIAKWFAAVRDIGWMGAAEAGEKAGNLQQAVQRDDLQNLARNPLLLTLMATLLANQARLPDDRTDLYDQVVDLLLRRWNEEVGLAQGLLQTLQVSTLKLSDLREAMQQLAFKAHLAHSGREGVADIPESEVLAVLRPLLLNSADKAELALRYIEERAGLLLSQGVQAGQQQYNFPHRTFQEFLAGCFLAAEQNFEERARQLADEDPAHWREALKFAARKATAGRGVPAADGLVCRQEFEAWHKAHALTGRDAQRALLAAEQLLEIGLAAVDRREEHRVVRQRIAGWLRAAITEDTLPPKERARAGQLLAQLGDPRRSVVPATVDDLGALEFCYVPPGPFLMGDEERRNDKLTQGYWISRFPVTVAQFRRFAEARADQFKPDWAESIAKRGAPFNMDNHPVVLVTWSEALAFCEWMTGHWRDRLPAGFSILLPSEAEWEKAARGGPQVPKTTLVRALRDGLTLPAGVTMEKNPAPDRRYPWLGDFDANKVNASETGIGTTSAVECFRGGRSPYAVEELSGNVWEWTRSSWEGRDDLNTSSTGARVLRGGAFGSGSNFVRCACRGRADPDGRGGGVGFRVVASPFISGR